jgi:hypothetical protein
MIKKFRHHLDSLRNLQTSRILAVSSFTHGVAILVVFGRDLALRSDSQAIMVYVNVDVLLGYTWQLEDGCNRVLLFVLVQIHSVKMVNYLVPTLREISGPYLGFIVLTALSTWWSWRR